MNPETACILRVETPGGVGCYNTLSNVQSAHRAHEMSGFPISREFHPSPCSDPDISVQFHEIVSDSGVKYDNIRFGFITPDQYFSWFRTEKMRQKLRAYGFVLSLYTVPADTVVSSKYQAFYSATDATLFLRLPTNAPTDEIRAAWEHGRSRVSVAA